MAYVTELKIVGLSRRKEILHYRFDRNVNIFWGINGTGKTSLLRIVNSALNNDGADLANVSFESAEVHIQDSLAGDVVRRISKKQNRRAESNPAVTKDNYMVFNLEPDVLEPELGEDQELVWRTSGEKGRSPIFVERAFPHRYLPTSRSASTRASRERNFARTQVAYRSNTELTNEQMLSNDIQRIWQSYYQDAVSEDREAQEQGVASILNALFNGYSARKVFDELQESPAEAHALINRFLENRSIQLGMNERDFAALLIDKDYLRLLVPIIREIEETVKLIWQPKLTFEAIIERMYSGNKHLISNRRHPALKRGNLGVDVNGEPIPLELLSSGEIQLLRLLLEALVCGDSVLIIDEPEISLHIDWQSELVKSMQLINPKCQLVLATHSPFVMTDVDENSIMKL